jgi:NDP-sugar pyrophosphorylase family protein
MPPVAILAGGLATRMRPVTERLPKSLLDIAGEPFITHQLRLLRARGIDRVVLCLGHLGEMIRDVVDDGSQFGLAVAYSYDGPTLLGTAGAIKQALPNLGETFFVLYGDSYLDCDYRDVAAAFASSGKLALMTVYRNEGKWDTSNVEYDGSRILAYDKVHRTERMHHIDWGLGVFRREAFSRVPEGETCDLATLYERLLGEGELAAIEVTQRFYEVGSLEGIATLRDLLHSPDRAMTSAPSGSHRRAGLAP